MRFVVFFIAFSSLFSAAIRLQDQVIECEIAKTYEARAKGLMGRRELSCGKGMLFVYPHAQKLCFWMKNTLIPLSIGFFDEDRKLIKMLDMDPPVGENYTKYYCEELALYALEVPQGWFEKHEIRIGDKFSFLETPK